VGRDNFRGLRTTNIVAYRYVHVENEEEKKRRPTRRDETRLDSHLHDESRKVRVSKMSQWSTLARTADVAYVSWSCCNIRFDR
jgi:hypothetical protein